MSRQQSGPYSADLKYADISADLIFLAYSSGDK